MLHKYLIALTFVICYGASLMAQQADFDNAKLKKGLELIEQGKELEAIPHLQAAVDSFEAQKNWAAYKAGSEYLLEVHFNMRKIQAGVAIAEKTISTLRENAPDQNLHQIYGYQGALNSRHNPPAAVEAHLQQLESLEKIVEKDSSFQYAEAYNDLAEAYLNSRNFAKAVDYYKKAGDVCLATAKTEKEEQFMWLVYYNLGFANSVMGSSDQALAYYAQSEAVLKKFDMWNQVESIRLSQMVAREYSIINEPYRALAHAKNILFRIEKSELDGFLIRQSLLPYTYTILALQYRAINDFENAIESYRKILELLEENRGQDFQFFSNYVRLASVYRSAGQIDSAQVYLQKADEIIDGFSDAQKSSGSYASSLRMHAQVWGFVYIAKGEYEKAETYFRQMLAYSQGFTRTSYSYLMDMSHLFTSSGQIDSAIYYSQQALLGACFDPEAVGDGLPKMSNIRSPENMYRIPLRRSRLEVLAQAGKEGIEKGLTYIDFSDKVHRENLRRMNVFRGNSKTLVEQSVPVYQQGVVFAHQMSDLEADAEWAYRAFAYGQRKKAQKLWLSLLGSDARQFANIPATVLEEENKLQTQIQGYREQLQTAREQGDTAQMRVVENEYLFDTQNKYQALVRTMEAEYPEFYASKYQFEVPSEATIQKELQKDELILDYVVTDSALYIFAIGKNQALQVEKVALKPDFKDQINRMNQLLRNSPMNRPRSRNQFIQLSYGLYQQLIQPFEKMIQDKDRLIIIGDGLISYVPFEVLLASDVSKPFTDLGFLIKEKEISYHYSINLLLKSRQEAVRGEGALFAFAPVFDKPSAAMTELASMPGSEDAPTQRSTETDGTFRALPESEKEVRGIADVFEQKGYTNYKLKFREEADEQTLKLNLEEAYQFIHVASHSFANLEEPRFSGIACFSPLSGNEENGILYTGEIYNTSIQADLITLSSCESGYGALDLSEGILGLNRAFIYAGVPNVVYSLWKVYDKVSAQLMIQFYEAALTNNDYPAALREAKLRLLEDRSTASPHYWGAFLLMGR